MLNLLLELTLLRTSDTNTKMALPVFCCGCGSRAVRTCHMIGARGIPCCMHAHEKKKLRVLLKFMILFGMQLHADT